MATYNDVERAKRDVSPATSAGPDPVESLTFAQQQCLGRAVAKIVLLGAQVGVSIDQMILLLGSGLTVAELLEYLADQNGHVS